MRVYVQLLVYLHACGYAHEDVRGQHCLPQLLSTLLFETVFLGGYGVLQFSSVGWPAGPGGPSFFASARVAGARHHSRLLYHMSTEHLNSGHQAYAANTLSPENLPRPSTWFLLKLLIVCSAWLRNSHQSRHSWQKIGKSRQIRSFAAPEAPQVIDLQRA